MKQYTFTLQKEGRKEDHTVEVYPAWSANYVTVDHKYQRTIRTDSDREFFTWDSVIIFLDELKDYHGR